MSVVPYELFFNYSGPTWIQGRIAVWIRAPIVCTDGAVLERQHEAWLGQVAATSRSVTMRFLPRSIVRAGDLSKPRSAGSFVREIRIPKVFGERRAIEAVRHLAYRMSFLVAPQHQDMYSGKEARQVCITIRNWLEVHDVMEG